MGSLGALTGCQDFDMKFTPLISMKQKQLLKNHDFGHFLLFSRGHATLHLAWGLQFPPKSKVISVN